MQILTLTAPRLEVGEVARSKDRDRLELVEDQEVLVAGHDAVGVCGDGRPQDRIIVRIAADTLA